ncbi:MAG: PD-(D/E)XK nuclease family protein [Bacteroidota bacterium]
MRTTFLNAIADKIDYTGLDQFKSTCYVFPTKRAGAYFKQIIRKKYLDKAFWSPDVFSIEDFIVKLTGKRIASEFELILELFESYKILEPEITFDSFYDWGRIVLGDFDEVDRYLVDPEMLYRNLQNLKDIEAVFHSDDAKEALRNFRNSIEDHENSLLISQFLRTWIRVSEVYSIFQKRLREKKIAYAGMLYKSLSADLENGYNDCSYENIVFGGFNALTKSEEHIIDYLLKADKAVIYWDASEYFFDKDEEAGTFLKKYRKKWPHDRSKWIVSSDHLSTEKINVYGCSGAEQQSQLAGSLVKSEGLGNLRSAIVLADESLLTPLLFNMPDDFKLNITMGYPLRENPISNLAISFLKLLNIEKTQKGEIYFLKSNVKDFFEHPFIKSILPENQKLELRRSYVFAAKDLEDFLSIKPISFIKDALNDKDAFQSLSEFLVEIYYSFREKLDPISQEVVYHLVRHLKQLIGSIHKGGLTFEVKEQEKLFRDTIHSLKIPFSGEPFNGLQIMGFLETRSLDFENLIVLSVNEGVLPSERSYSTYIPFGLRKAYEMPTFEDQDSIYAYHFKRLLMRAKNIHLIYDTQLSYDGAGEISRFVAQLKNSTKKSDFELNEISVLDRHTNSVENTERIIHKNEEVMSALRKYWEPSGNKYLSPTALLNYLQDPVEFYIKNVLGIREPEELEDDFDPREIGNTIHKALEEIYKPFIGKAISSEEIKPLLNFKKIETFVLDSLLSERIIKDSKELKGKNELFHSIITEVIKQVLIKDQSDTPFKLMDLETNKLNNSIQVLGKEARLGGYVDRIDDKDGVIRILDYKTGKVKLPSRYVYSKLSTEDYVGLYFDNPDYKSGFQAYFYVFLYKRKYPDQQIKAGIYSLKQVNQGIQYLRSGDMLDDELIDAFGNRLIRLVEEIFNEKIPFRSEKDKEK